MFKVFDGFVSLDALVTLFADRGLVGDAGSVHGVDLVRLGSLNRLCHARNNQMLIKSQWKTNHLVPIICKIPIYIKTRSKLV